MSRIVWTRLAEARTEEELTGLQDFVQKGGYSAFHQLLEGFKEQLKALRDDEIPGLSRSLDTAKRLFPNPGVFSPSWLQIWRELEAMLAVKARLMEAVSIPLRDGEWQVILDNPHTIQEIVCHPGLTFDEAAYLYSYFRPGLEKNEYIRLQKVQNMMSDVGS